MGLFRDPGERERERSVGVGSDVTMSRSDSARVVTLARTDPKPPPPLSSFAALPPPSPFAAPPPPAPPAVLPALEAFASTAGCAAGAGDFTGGAGKVALGDSLLPRALGALGVLGAPAVPLGALAALARTCSLCALAYSILALSTSLASERFSSHCCALGFGARSDCMLAERSSPLIACMRLLEADRISRVALSAPAEGGTAMRLMEPERGSEKLAERADWQRGLTVVAAVFGAARRAEAGMVADGDIGESAAGAEEREGRRVLAFSWYLPRNSDELRRASLRRCSDATAPPVLMNRSEASREASRFSSVAFCAASCSRFLRTRASAAVRAACDCSALRLSSSSAGAASALSCC